MVTIQSGIPEQAATVAPVNDSAPKFVSCCPEELVEVELEGLRQGRERARADGAHAMHDMHDISAAAHVACDQAEATQYMPLDEARFRDVFTLAWCAGYHAEVTASARG